MPKFEFFENPFTPGDVVKVTPHFAYGRFEVLGTLFVSATTVDGICYCLWHRPDTNEVHQFVISCELLERVNPEKD